jgi:flagellar assembly factor FliW
MTTQAKEITETSNIIFPLTIENRFGDITIIENQLVAFPQGIYGFQEYNSYAIASFPSDAFPQFHVLQCLDEVGLSFLLTSLVNQGELLMPQSDLEEATGHLNLSFEQCDFYAITTVSEKEGILAFSLNLKAPVVVDKNDKKAWQYILEQSDYSTKHVIK